MDIILSNCFQMGQSIHIRLLVSFDDIQIQAPITQHVQTQRLLLVLLLLLLMRMTFFTILLITVLSIVDGGPKNR